MKRIAVGTVVALVVGLASMMPVAAAPQVPSEAPVLVEPAAPVATATEGDLTIEVTEPGPFVPGETLTIEVSGARHLSTVRVRQCDPAGGGCGMESYVTIGASGEGTTAIVARRRVPRPGGGGFVDCALEPCALVAEQWGTELEAVASVPMAIDPAAPVPRPTLRVLETDPLGAFEQVTVEGAGFDTVQIVAFAECGWNPPDEVIPCVDLGAYAFVQPDGTFTTTVPVSRILQDLDCAARFGRCQLWAFPYGSLDQIWATRLGFDGSSPPSFPEIQVTPSTELLHRQVVSITGAHLQPGSSVQITQCLAVPPTGQPGCGSYVYAATSTTGTFVAPFAVGRVVAGHDCAIEACVIRVRAGAGTTAEVPIAFDETVPPPPPPMLTVEPADGLADRQVVSVTVTETEPGSGLAFATCVVGTQVCRGSSYTQAPPGGGTVTVPITVYRNPAGEVDCAVAACEIRASLSFGAGLVLTAPVTFDPDSPIAPPPIVRVLPAAGLWDRQNVAVRGEHFDAGGSLMIRVCVGDPAVPDNCETSSRLWPQVDALGRFEGRLTLDRSPAIAGRTPDCLVEACQLVASQYGSSVGALAVAPLAFDPNQPIDQSDLPAQLPCVAWPTDGWPTGPLPAGVDPAAVEAAGQQSIDYGSTGVVVIHGGRLVYEKYDEAGGNTAATIQPSMSISKSFTATMVGLLVDDGLIDIDEPAMFPEWSDPSDIRSTMTPRHLLNMESGLQFSEGYGDPTSDVMKLVQADDAAAYMIERPARVAPGTAHAYSTGDTMLLSKLIGDAAGVSGPSYQTLLQDRLFGPLGIDPVSAGFDGAGRWRSGWWTNTTTRNFAKLGLLYLRHGVWEGEQFLSTDWVDFVRTPSPLNTGYGAQFWLNGDGSFSMVGLGGQQVLIVPQHDLIVAVNNGGSPGTMAQLFAGASPATCDGEPVMALVDDEASVGAGGSGLIDVLANDVPGLAGIDAATLTVASSAAHGIAVVEGGMVRYEPDDGFVGTDTFSYLVCSTVRRPCLEATVTVVVGAPPPPSPGPAAAARTWPELPLVGPRDGWLMASAHP